MASATVRGEVSAAGDPSYTFQGNEKLQVSAIDASRMDAASITLGEQEISLKQGQNFPIQFQFSYDKSRAGPGYRGLLMQARISDRNGRLLYINDTTIPLTDNVTVNVVKA